jgi:hypothetical protein
MVMKYKATLKTESWDAKSVSAALNVDNIKLEKLKIKSGHMGAMVVTEVESESLSTLANTLDDLLSCQLASEKLIKKQD